VVPRCLTIATSDSGGGAGIQADLKAFARLGCHGMSAIVALTAQNTTAVTAVHEAPPAFARAQLDAVFDDIGVDAAKTGMLANTAIVEAVATTVAGTAIGPLVVDPVFVSKHGHRLLEQDAIGALRSRILPLATLVTPNLPEAAGLAGVDVETRGDMRRAADAILALGAGAVLVKGGHLAGDRASDLLVHAGGEEWLEMERIDTRNTHGTGCTLSSAAAARLALGDSVPEAARAAKAFVTEAIRHALALGHGIGPVDALWPIPPGGVPEAD
jgi:hydroxymethylpyrimidine/phosphomethylpyrimidine kinase